MEPARLHIALRWMTRFRCVGPECEDVCCTGWAVPVDEAHHRALAERLSPDELARTVFAGHGAREKGRHALMVLRDDGRCTMLEDGGLCSIQRRFGEDLLPDTCAIYPRSVGRVGDRVELAGSLSCPEAARRCLLDEDATELVEVDASLVPRPMAHKELAAAPADFYEASFDDVRGAVYQLLSLRRYPMASRLFFVVYLAQQAKGALKRGAPTPDPRAFAALLALPERADVLDGLHRQLAGISVEDPFASSVVVAVLRTGRAAGTPQFRRLVERTFATYGLYPDDDVDLERLHAAWERRRRAVPDHLAPRVDLFLENFCANHLFKEWFIRSAAFVDWVQGLLVRVAVLRFLLVSHPGIDGVRLLLDPAEQSRTLDRSAVEVFYGFARVIEHDETMARDVLRALAAQQMQSVAHAIALLKS